MYSELSESEAFRIIAESTGDAILIITIRGDIVFANAATSRIFGYQTGEVLGMSAALLLSIEDRPQYVELFRRYVQTGKKTREWEGFPLTGLNRSGEPFPMEVSFGEFRSDGNRLFTLMVRDYSERRRKDEQIRNFEHRVRMLINQISGALWTTDADLRITSCEGAGLGPFSVKPEELIGKTISEVVGTSDPSHFSIASHLKALAGERVFQEGEWSGRVLECHFEPFRDSAGKIVGCMGLALDVTEKKIAERALRNSEQRYRDLFEHNLAGVFQSTPEGRILNCNDSFARILGYTRDEMLRLPALELYTEPVYRESFMALLQEHRALTNVEYPLRRKDGSTIWILENVCLLRDGSRETLLGTMIDITELKQTEARLRRAEQMEFLGRLVSGVAHEIRSPLFAICTAAQVLEKRAPQEAQYASLILKQVERLKNLTTDLLDLGRPATAWLMTDHDVCELILTAKQHLEVSSSAAVGRIALQEVRGVLVHGNPDKLIQVFHNIMENATQHSPDGSRVNVAITESAKQIIVGVRDSGPGILPANLEQVFEPFFTTRAGGVGLGLMIAKQIMDAHRGNIRVRNNEPGPGCTFELVFPRPQPPGENQ